MNESDLIRHFKPIFALAVEEDIGAGDITTEALIPEGKRGQGRIVAKDQAVLCGLTLVDFIFRQNKQANTHSFFKDGDEVGRGKTVYEVDTSLKILLSYERIALNILQRLSGIASKVRDFCRTLAPHSNVKIVDTRKTTPGYRFLEKYAVTVGGGKNHRMGLYDHYLIKDNHIAVVGGISSAVRAVRNHRNRQKNGSRLLIEVECKTLEQVEEAKNLMIDVIMLDNMSNDDISKSRRLIPSHIEVEVSGNVTQGRLPSLARMSIDSISSGDFTHSFKAKDFSMQIDQ